MMDQEDRRRNNRARMKRLHRFEEFLELPVTVLGILWLILIVLELVAGLGPVLNAVVYVIWGIFIIDFLVRFLLAPQKIQFMKKNWLTALSLVIPAFRVFRVLRLFRIVRLLRAGRGSIRLVRLVASLNRGMRVLRKTMRRRGFRYVVILTVIMTLVGAAGMYAFEQESAGGEGFESFGDALWWTAMIMTTLGSASWPVTVGGRILAFLLALYGFGIFGYLTAVIATFLIGRDAESDETEIAGMQSVESLKEDIAALRKEIRDLSNKM